ncbi:MAG: type II CAAX endopeptidase family protein [Sphingomonas sp.]
MPPIEPVTPPDSLVWRIIHFPLVLLVIAIATMMGAGLLARVASHAIPHAGNGWAAMLVAVLASACFVAGYFIFVRFIERRARVDEFAPSGWARELGFGLATGFALFSIVIGIIAIGGGYRIVGTHPAQVVLPVLALSITAGVTEEIILRGIFFRLVESWLGSWIALAASAALFGALHLGNPNATLVAGAAIALEAGIMLAALYMLTRRLWAAIGVHAAWNFTQGGVYGIAVSGFRQDGLFVPHVAGSDLLTGGSFGAEASLPAIVVCTLAGAAILWKAYRKGNFVAPFWVRGAKPDQPAGLQA